MTKQTYEMIEGQAGGSLEAAAAGEEDESGALLPSSPAPLHRGRIALFAGMLAVALLVGYVSSPRASVRGTAGTHVYL